MEKIIYRIKKYFSHSGFSLLELLVTLAIFGILIATTTNIIVLNLTAARKIKSRSYVREESAFMLNVLKKDIRNANSISCPTGVGTFETCTSNQEIESLLVKVTDETGLTKDYVWQMKEDRIMRYLGPSENEDITFATPGDIEFAQEDGFQLSVTCEDENCLVSIHTKAWTIGMPGSEEDLASRQWMEKKVSVSTRNFNFE